MVTEQKQVCGNCKHKTFKDYDNKVVWCELLKLWLGAGRVCEYHPSKWEERC